MERLIQNGLTRRVKWTGKGRCRECQHGGELSLGRLSDGSVIVGHEIGSAEKNRSLTRAVG